jgi:hypothetical protein
MEDQNRQVNVKKMMIVGKDFSVIITTAIKILVFVLNSMMIIAVGLSRKKFVVVMAKLTKAIVKEPMLEFLYYSPENAQCVILLVKKEKDCVVQDAKEQLSVQQEVLQNVL